MMRVSAFLTKMRRRKRFSSHATNDGGSEAPDDTRCAASDRAYESGIRRKKRDFFSRRKARYLRDHYLLK